MKLIAGDTSIVLFHGHLLIVWLLFYLRCKANTSHDEKTLLLLIVFCKWGIRIVASGYLYTIQHHLCFFVIHTTLLS